MKPRINKMMVLSDDFLLRKFADLAKSLVGLSDPPFGIGDRDNRMVIQGGLVCVQFVQRPLTFF